MKKLNYKKLFDEKYPTIVRLLLLQQPVVQIAKVVGIPRFSIALYLKKSQKKFHTGAFKLTLPQLQEVVTRAKGGMSYKAIYNELGYPTRSAFGYILRIFEIDYNEVVTFDGRGKGQNFSRFRGTKIYSDMRDRLSELITSGHTQGEVSTVLSEAYNTPITPFMVKKVWRTLEDEYKVFNRLRKNVPFNPTRYISPSYFKILQAYHSREGEVNKGVKEEGILRHAPEFTRGGYYVLWKKWNRLHGVKQRTYNKKKKETCHEEPIGETHQEGIYATKDSP